MTKNNIDMQEVLNKLNMLLDELSNNPDAWRVPEMALIRVMSTTLEELTNLANIRRTEDS